MARRANFRPSKKHYRAEFWLDVELLDPNFASLVCRYMLVYLNVIEMCWNTLVEALCLKILT